MKFIESIRLENGELMNLELHQRRADMTLLAHFGAHVHIDLGRELTHRSLPAGGLYKVRVTYDREIAGIDVDPYTRAEIRGIELVEASDLDYRYKYAERSALDALRERVPPGVQPVVVQDGYISDALYANLCLFDGNAWLTPARPLLEGTARAAALARGEVKAAPVRAEDFRKGKFTHVKLINCMTYFAEAQEVPC
jgi:4-amino-4-deoxychorismate lyase